MSDAEIIFNVHTSKFGDLGEIILNRPKALNALSFVMCESLLQQLQAWQVDPNIKGVVIRGAGERAFCAGGDVRAIFKYRHDVEACTTFFRTEYRMNKAVFHFNKPYISLLDGITMGGGAGVSIHGSHRISSEFFSFAMPETAIGFFPDIGGSHFLNNCPNKIGYYLGLTGITINAADALALGLTQHHVMREKLPALFDELVALDFGPHPHETVSNLIERYHQDPGLSTLMQQKTQIQQCFDQANLSNALNTLASFNNDWSSQTLSTLAKRSPTSLVITFEALKRAEKSAFDEIMQTDFNLAYAFMQGHDFFEGVRAVLVDKDQSPRWHPANIHEIDEGKIFVYFSEKSLL